MPGGSMSKFNKEFSIRAKARSCPFSDNDCWHAQLGERTMGIVLIPLRQTFLHPLPFVTKTINVDKTSCWTKKVSDKEVSTTLFTDVNSKGSLWQPTSRKSFDKGDRPSMLLVYLQVQGP